MTQSRNKEDRDYAEFIHTVLDFYYRNGRDLPWRRDITSYRILVSELMLQQTQVVRVIPKFNDFLTRFPTVFDLAAAPQSAVLQAWSGLGYNRRARFLHVSAQQIIDEYGGQIPSDVEKLRALPGIGYNTAAAIAVYGFEKPHVFIETNIRTVYLYHFFNSERDVSDARLLPLIEATLQTDNPRNWYWALMDYGSNLKRRLPNPSRASRHHMKQSKFEGSRRQLRGRIIKLLLEERAMTEVDVKQAWPDERIQSVLQDLQKEGFIRRSGKHLLLVE